MLMFRWKVSPTTSVMDRIPERRTSGKVTGPCYLRLTKSHLSFAFYMMITRLGFRHRFAPGAVLIGMYSHETFDSQLSDTIGFDFPYSLTDEGGTDFTEMRDPQQSL